MTAIPLRRYRPASALEAFEFSDRFCCRCKNDENEDCEIPALMTFMQVTDDGYPDELTYDNDGEPCCKAFEPAEKEAWQKTLDEISGGAA